jgi:tetratricopeptide (TPR) repeat protein
MKQAVNCRFNKMAVFMAGMLILVSAGGCKERADKQLERDRERILELDRSLYDKTGNLPGYIVAEEAIVAFREFGNNYPEDSLALPFHIKAGDIAFTLGKIKTVTEIYGEILTLYPSGDHTPYLYLRLGNLYNDELQDTVTARIYFERLIAEYPEGKRAEDAATMLEMLGLSIEEQMEVIKRRNREIEGEESEQTAGGN